MKNQNKENLILAIYRWLFPIIIIIGIFLIVIVAVLTQRFPEGLILGLILGSLIAGLGYWRYQKTLKDAEKAQKTLKKLVHENSLSEVLRPKKCPDCGALIPSFRFPKSMRQALWGGSTCPNCGVELDRFGNVITNK